MKIIKYSSIKDFNLFNFSHNVKHYEKNRILKDDRGGGGHDGGGGDLGGGLLVGLVLSSSSEGLLGGQVMPINIKEDGDGDIILDPDY